MSIKIALAGNPNSGKTTLFNALTGSSQYVGNWPGVTVEKKEGKLKGNKEVRVQDLPGIYSLSPYTLEEVITRNYLVTEKPDVIINIVDATNIERNLYLTTQLMELGAPVVLALNMMDVVRKNGDKINTKKLADSLGCQVVEISALKGDGVKEVADQAIKLARDKAKTPARHRFGSNVERAIEAIENAISGKVDADVQRWYAIKLFERDAKVTEQLKLPADTAKAIEAAVAACEADEDDDAESIITSERYDYIGGIIGSVVKKKKAGEMSTSDKIDRIVTHRIWGLPIFLAVMFLVYGLAVMTVGTAGVEWVEEVLFEETIAENLEEFMEDAEVNEGLIGLVIEGIIGGVGAVLAFVPQMIVLFLCLSILEDIGYMARVAFVMDRVFRKFGLSGKSFIPIMIGTGCAVPGIMASRTIESESDRKMTVMLTPFIPCGAKLPVIAMIAGALFGNSVWITFSAYVLGIVLIIVSGVILKKFKSFAGEPSPFVMELPTYHAPGVRGVLWHTWDRVWSFIKRAGTLILLSCIVIWFLSSFGFEDGSFGLVDADDSILASLGRGLAYVFIPLGFGRDLMGELGWQASAATVTGFLAKENLVATFGVLLAGLEEISEEGEEIWGALAASYSALAAYSLMAFNLFSMPCFAAVGATRREMGTWKWTMITVGFQMLMAYCVSLIIYNFGMLFTGEGFTFWTAVAIVLVGLLIYLLLRKPYRPERLDAAKPEKVGV